MENILTILYLVVKVLKQNYFFTTRCFERKQTPLIKIIKLKQNLLCFNYNYIINNKNILIKSLLSYNYNYILIIIRFFYDFSI